MADIYGMVEHSVLYYNILDYTLLYMEVHDSTQEQRKKNKETKTTHQYFLPVFRYFLNP